jgi:hypothetical protein
VRRQASQVLELAAPRLDTPHPFECFFVSAGGAVLGYLAGQRRACSLRNRQIPPVCDGIASERVFGVHPLGASDGLAKAGVTPVPSSWAAP